MCIVSMVYDHYQDKWPLKTGTYTWPAGPLTVDQLTEKQKEEIRELIKQFYSDLKAAEQLDKHLNQPDCEDLEKAKLLEKIKALETELAKRKARKRRKK